MDDLVAFLKERTDEDEAVAKRAAAAPAVQHEGSEPGDWSWLHTYGQPQPEMVALIDHQARFDPARAFREVAAKRVILKVHDLPEHRCPLPVLPGPMGQLWTPDEGPCWTLRLLGAIYSDHPGYRQEWAP